MGIEPGGGQMDRSGAGGRRCRGASGHRGSSVRPVPRTPGRSPGPCGRRRSARPGRCPSRATARWSPRPRGRRPAAGPPGTPRAPAGPSVGHRADQRPLGDQPRVAVVVVDPHRAAHHHQSGDRPVIGKGIPAVDPDHLVPVAGARSSAPAMRPGSLVGDVLDDRPRRSCGRAPAGSGRVAVGVGAGHYPVATTWKASASASVGQSGGQRGARHPGAQQVVEVVAVTDLAPVRAAGRPA